MRDYSPEERTGGFRKCVAILLLLSIFGNLIVDLYKGYALDIRIGSYAGWAGELTGEAIASFVVAMIFFGIVRMVRKTKTPTAGLITGVVVTLIWCAMLFQYVRLQVMGVYPPY